MEIQITNHSKFQDLSSWEQAVSRGLDQLWRQPWLTQSLSKEDQERLPVLQDLAQEMCAGSDQIVVVAEPFVARTVAAAMALMEERRTAPAVTLFPATLSPVDYDALFQRLGGQRVRLLAIACGPESLALRGAYAILKQFVFSQGQPVASPVCAVTGAGSQAIAQDCAENDYPVIGLPDDAELWQLATSPALLLPLLLAGGDGEAYLEGFREMLADPGWDRDATVLAKGRLQARAEKMPIYFRTWQRELAPMTQCLASCSGQTGEAKSAVWLPDGEELQAQEAGKGPSPGPETLAIDLSLAEGPLDLMTPSFEGCHPDGSLALLLQEQAPQIAKASGAIHLAGAGVGTKAAGAWMAFCQLSEGIVRNIP